MKQIIGILLLVVGLYLGYAGINKYSNSGESVEVLGVEISAKDNNSRTTAFIYIGLAVVCLFGGITLLKSGKSS